MTALCFNPKAIAAIQPLKPELQRMYSVQDCKKTDLEISMEIERRWGDWLVEKVCKSLGVNEAGCLILALAAAKGQI